jgi:hypothetical protein
MSPLEHLSAEEVMAILDIVQDADPIVVGGQAVNIWAEHYSEVAKELVEYGPYTSKDIDFYRNRDAAYRLSEALNGKLLIPEPGNYTPNDSLVIGKFGDRNIEVDFMATVLGVEDSSIQNNYITLTGVEKASSREVRILLLWPLDCVRSRFANLNILGRNDPVAIRQAQASLIVLREFIKDLIVAGSPKVAMRILHDMYYVIKDEHLRKPTDAVHRLDPMPILREFLGHEGLDERWRTLCLAHSIARLEDKIKRFAALQQAPEDPQPAPAI